MLKQFTMTFRLTSGTLSAVGKVTGEDLHVEFPVSPDLTDEDMNDLRDAMLSLAKAFEIAREADQTQKRRN